MKKYINKVILAVLYIVLLFILVENCLTGLSMANTAINVVSFIALPIIIIIFLRLFYKLF